MERQRQQALLSAAHDAIADVEERAAYLAVDEVLDPADLLDRIETPRLCRRGTDSGQSREAGCVRPDRQLLLRVSARKHESCGGEDLGEHSSQITRQRADRLESLLTS